MCLPEWTSVVIGEDVLGLENFLDWRLAGKNFFTVEIFHLLEALTPGSCCFV
jgi:hypothetical protein